MTTLAPFLSHHPFGVRRPTRPRPAVRKILDRLATDTTLSPIMLTLTTSIRATAPQIRALGRRFVAACPELPLVELRHERSPVGRQHLHALVLAPESVTEADLVSRWTGLCPETSEAAQHAVTVEADTSALSRVWSYISKKGSALVARIRRAVASVTPARVCSECGCSLDDHRPHAVTCGPTCRQRRSRRLRRKRDSAVAPSRAHTSLRAGAYLDDPRLPPEIPESTTETPDTSPETTTRRQSGNPAHSATDLDRTAAHAPEHPVPVVTERRSLVPAPAGSVAPVEPHNVSEALSSEPRSVPALGGIFSALDRLLARVWPRLTRATRVYPDVDSGGSC